jgi:hypothetical protein
MTQCALLYGVSLGMPVPVTAHMLNLISSLKSSTFFLENSHQPIRISQTSLKHRMFTEVEAGAAFGRYGI